MTDKERLEEISERVIVDKVYYKYLDGTKGHWGKVYTLSEEDYNYLIERVQELENHIDHLYDNNVHLKGDYRLQEQNKRYREALEAIAYFEDKEEGEVATRIDVKYIARKALEESE